MIGPERLYTREEFETLQEWSFIRDFEKGRVYFVDLVSAIYSTLQEMDDAESLDKIVIAGLLTDFLKESVIFDKMIRDKLYIRQPLKPLFGDIFARYVVSEVWDEITWE